MQILYTIDVFVVLCLVVLGSRAEDAHKVETKHSALIPDNVSTDSGVHHMKKTVDDGETRSILKHDDNAHLVDNIGDIRKVNGELEVRSDKTASGKKMKKRLSKKRKLISKIKQRTKGRRNRIRIKTARRKPDKKNIFAKRTGRKNKSKNAKAFKKPKPQSNNRRKLQARMMKTIVDKIAEEHKTGKGSKITTKYLQKRIRALLENQGFYKVANCKTRRKLKARRIKNRKRILRKLKANKKDRKQIRNLRPRLMNKNKKVSRKVKKAMKDKKGKRNKGQRSKTNGRKGKKNRKRKINQKTGRANNI